MADPRDPPVSALPQVALKINGVEIIPDLMRKFEWDCFVNGGYWVEAVVGDPNHYILSLLGEISESKEGVIFGYLIDGRVKPVEIEWELTWTGTNLKTEKRIAYMVSVTGHGKGLDASFTFCAQDPPTFLLSAGTASGKVYTGRIGGKDGVIAQCVEEFTALSGADPIEVNVSDTSDSQDGKWPMFRRDPRTYISSLLEWSATLSDSDRTRDTRWLVAAKDRTLNIRKADELKDDGKHIRLYYMREGAAADNVLDWELEMNNYMTLYQGRIVTAGTSATSGAEIEQVLDDEATIDKLGVSPGQDQAFTHPEFGDEDPPWPVDLPATFIRAAPEHSGGEVAQKYQDYMDGHARQYYLDMFTNIMRMQINVLGEHRLDSSERLGVDICSIGWKGKDGNHFPHGKWIIDGFRHILRRSGKGGMVWTTNIHVYREDHQSTVTSIENQPKDSS